MAVEKDYFRMKYFLTEPVLSYYLSRVYTTFSHNSEEFNIIKNLDIEKISQFIIQHLIDKGEIRDKYDLTDDYYQNIHFIKDSMDLVKKEYRPTNIVIIDNHTFSCLSKSTQAIVKKFFLTIDPFFPSMTNYEELDKEKKFNIYNEIKLWVDDE